jgi:UDP-glucuronate 4-epimerase
VFGVDNLNDYYDVGLKEAPLAILSKDKGFEFLRMDIADRVAMDELFSSRRFETVYHMAAQAGVRYSVENPHAYVDSNLVGFLNVLEGCRSHCSQETHLIYPVHLQSTGTTQSCLSRPATMSITHIALCGHQEG